MKIRDIVEYGLVDEPAPNYSKAQVRKDISNQQNAIRRQINRATDQNREFNIKQNQQSRDANRDVRRIPTGTPNRAAYDNMRQDLLRARGVQNQ